MRVFPRFKFLSRAVHEEQEGEHDGERNKYPLTEGSLCTSLTLTVWKKSLVISCKGFTVIDSYGNLAYRVDNYIGHPNEVILMDASGNSVLTLHRSRVCMSMSSSPSSFFLSFRALMRKLFNFSVQDFQDRSRWRNYKIAILEHVKFLYKEMGWDHYCTVCTNYNMWMVVLC